MSFTRWVLGSCLFVSCASVAALGACHRQKSAVHAPPATERAAHYPGKLPQGVTPRLYDVHWTLDPNAAEFSGEVTIAVDLREPHRQIYLHAEGLQFTRVSVEDADGRRQIGEVIPDKTPGLIALQVPLPIAPGMASLRFAYHAPFSSGLLGLYRTQAAGQQYVFSQFEAVAARRALPCFDEPRFKTPFQVRVTAPKDVAVLSNGPAVGDQVIDLPGGVGSSRIVSFAQTPPLPTYLLAVAVGHFDVREAQIDATPLRDYPLAVRAFGVAGQSKRLQTSLHDAAQLLAAHESYADLPYPFAKLDLLAVPDFGFGAMENAGLITFRDWLILQDPSNATYSQRRIAISVLSHELTHQWFGNWVTMPWWDDLWLNEGFAVWRGQKTAHQVRPHMGFDVELILSMNLAMHQDALKSARRVREPCKTRDDITNAADGITYMKGSALLTMAEHWLGAERMTRGVRSYLAAHPFGSASSTTFLQAIAQAAEEPRLPQVMQSFLNQPGVPELYVSLDCQKDEPVVSVSQERFRPLGSDATGGPWQIPVCLRYGDENGRVQRVCRLLDESSERWALRGRCPRWLVANADGAGYYRVRMGPTAWDAALAAWRSGRLSVAESVAFLSNVSAQMESGALAPAAALGVFAEGLSHSEAVIVEQSLNALADEGKWAMGQNKADGVPGLRPLLLPVAERLSAQAAALNAERAREQRHGRLGEAAFDRFGQVDGALRNVRHRLVTLASEPQLRASLSHAGVAWLGQLEARYRKPGSELPLHFAPETGGLIGEDIALALAVACDTMGAPFFERLQEALLLVEGGEERRRLIEALSLVRVPALAERVRALAISGTVHRNEVLSLVQPQVAHPALSDAAWAFVLDNAEVLMQRMSDEQYHRLIGLGGYRCDAGSATALHARMDRLLPRIPGGPRAMAQAEEAIALCAAFRAAQGEQISEWFAALPLSSTGPSQPSAEQTTTRP